MNEIENLIVQFFPPSDVPSKTRIMGLILAKADAGPAAALLCAAIANMVGHIPDDKWQEMMDFKFPVCPTPGCNCHLHQEKFLKDLIPIREVFKRATENQDEKGLAE